MHDTNIELVANTGYKTRPVEEEPQVLASEFFKAVFKDDGLQFCRLRI